MDILGIWVMDRRMRCRAMKRYVCLVYAFLLVPLYTFAGWQVSNPETAYPREPFFGAATIPKAGFRPTGYSTKGLPNQFANLGQNASIYAISVSGSVKDNLERIMGRYRWRVVWKAPYDYNFDGRVTGASLPNVVEKLLKPFPLKAVMYMSNRTLTIMPS